MKWGSLLSLCAVSNIISQPSQLVYCAQCMHVRYCQLSVETPWQLSRKFTVWVATAELQCTPTTQAWNHKRPEQTSTRCTKGQKGIADLVCASLVHSKAMVELGVAAWSIPSYPRCRRSKLHKFEFYPLVITRIRWVELHAMQCEPNNVSIWIKKEHSYYPTAKKYIIDCPRLPQNSFFRKHAIFFRPQGTLKIL